MASKKVGLIGCGTIGGSLAVAIDSGKIPKATLESLFDVIKANADALQQKLIRPANVYDDFASFLLSDMDITIEAASQQAVKTFAIPVVAAGKDLMLMSVGALADIDFQKELLGTARKRGSKIYLPSGAIAGIDAIRSVKDLIEEVTLTTTKNPGSLAGAPFFAARKREAADIRKREVIYSGPASEAVTLFPANVNVAAVLSLAGIGPDRTTVKIIADPDATTNRHEIAARGSFGEIQISVNNVQSPGNPKTSYLAVLSAIECLRSICDDSIRIGS
jgi:aspartate dehydrogenase